MSRFFEKKVEEYKYISPGSIGGKIKKYRELRGLTQKQLGILAGFKSTNADSRIAQYEMNDRVPSRKIVEKIAEGLNIEADALYETDVIPLSTMYHILFDIGEFHGLHPVEINGQYYLSFERESLYDSNAFEKTKKYEEFLKDWLKAEKLNTTDSEDNPEMTEKKKSDYAIWMAEYPENEFKKQKHNIKNYLEKEKHLRAIDQITLEEKAEDTDKRIKEALETVLQKVESNYIPSLNESDLIFLIEEMLASGIRISKNPVEWDPKADYGYIHFLSVNVEDVLASEKNKELYAKLWSIIRLLRNEGADIIDKLVCRYDVIYITFKYSVKTCLNFKNLNDVRWNILEWYAGHKDEEDIKTDRKLLSEHITGDKDCKLFEKRSRKSE